MKKILGTGLTGLVGSRVIELLGDKFDFKNLDLTTGVDITEKSQLESKIVSSKAEVFLHMAAFTDVNAAWKQRGNKKGECFRVNVLGTRNLASLCQKYNKFLIHFSTDFVFDGKKETPYTEEDQPKPIEWYGQTKYWAEEEVKKATNDFCIVRIAFPYRAKFSPKIDLIRRIVEGFEKRNLHRMFVDQITTPTFIDDIAYGLEKVFEVRPRGIFHLVASSFQSPYELAIQVAEVFGFDKKLVKRGSLVEYQKSQSSSARPWHKFLGLSNDKAQKELGIRMSLLKEGLEKMRAQWLES